MNIFELNPQFQNRLIGHNWGNFYFQNHFAFSPIPIFACNGRTVLSILKDFFATT